jgi:hypothetical protein
MMEVQKFMAQTLLDQMNPQSARGDRDEAEGILDVKQMKARMDQFNDMMIGMTQVIHPKFDDFDKIQQRKAREKRKRLR